MKINGANYPLLDGTSSAIRSSIKGHEEYLMKTKNNFIKAITLASKLESVVDCNIEVSYFGHIQVRKVSGISDNPDRDFLLLFEKVCDVLQYDPSFSEIRKMEHSIECTIWSDPSVTITHIFSDQDICVKVTTYETKKVPVTKYVCTSK